MLPTHTSRVGKVLRGQVRGRASRSWQGILCAEKSTLGCLVVLFLVIFFGSVYLYNPATLSGFGVGGPESGDEEHRHKGVLVEPGPPEELPPVAAGGAFVAGDEERQPAAPAAAPPPPPPPPPPPVNTGVDVARRDKVKEMMKHAWDGYAKHAWGHNEVRPISLSFHDNLFGKMMGATVVDSLSTLLVMGMRTEYEAATEWVTKSLSFDVFADVSVFETTIRMLGGLLSAYALSGDRVHLTKATDVANRLLPAFDSPHGLPYAMVNLKTGSKRNWPWSSSSSIAAEFGTLKLEFDYLSDLTGNPVYREKIERIYTLLDSLDKPLGGLYPVYINTQTGKWGQTHVTLGALGDSFYEYLLKAWVMSGKTESRWRRLYDDTADQVLARMVVKSTPSQLTYIAEYRGNHLDHKMDHLACFAGGMFALGAADSRDPARHFEVGAELTHTCHVGYSMQPTGICPEVMRFAPGRDISGMRQNERYYILRPETVESYFYLWRLTHDQKYRDWGWEVVEALEKHCRQPGGYSGLRDVTQDPPRPDDVQQSFFLAETLKYLFLLFSDDHTVSLDDYVFNTEAHPLPIKTRRDSDGLRKVI